MPLTPAGQSWVAQLRQGYPKLKGLSDEALVKMYLEAQAKNEHKDNPDTPDIHEDDPKVWLDLQRQRAGLPEGGPIHSALSGIWDGINPTPWGRSEERIGDWPGARMAGQMAGTVATFEAAPLAALKIAKGLGLGAKAATALDIGYRGLQGATTGYRDMDEMSKQMGQPLDTGAAITSALSGAGGMMLPLDFAPSGIKSMIGKKAFNSAGMTAAGLGQMAGMTEAMSQQSGKSFGDVANAEWQGMKENPTSSIGMAGGMALAPWLFKPSANGFHFSKVGDIFDKLKRPTRTGATTPVAAASTATGRSGGDGPSMANVPPPPSSFDSADAVSRALSPEGMDLTGIGPSSRVPATEDAIRKRLEQLAMLDQVKQAIGTAPIVSHFKGDIYQPAVPGFMEARTRLLGSSGDQVLGGEDLASAQRIEADKLWNNHTQVMHHEGRNFVLGPGYRPLTSGQIFPDMLEEGLASQMGIPREGLLYGRGAKDFLFAPSGMDKGFPVPAEALPQMNIREKTIADRRAADAQPKGQSMEMAMSADNARTIPKMSPGDPMSLIDHILHNLTEDQKTLLADYQARQGKISVEGLGP